MLFNSELFLKIFAAVRRKSGVKDVPRKSCEKIGKVGDFCKKFLKKLLHFPSGCGILYGCLNAWVNYARADAG